MLTSSSRSSGRFIRLATFRASEQTHLAVPPQRRALEPIRADNSGRDETADGHPALPGADTEHGREETTGETAPAVGGVTRESGAGREAHASVFVLSKDGSPLDPCHPARARKLLAQGRAVVSRRVPFVIRLKDRDADSSEVQGVEIGIDPGSEYTGISVFSIGTDRMRAGTYGIQLKHRGAQIRKKLHGRSAYRRNRRYRNLRHRAPRFLNRRKPSGWIAPSLRHRVVTTATWIARFQTWAPVRAIHLEVASFDVHSLSEERQLSGGEYQQGTLSGYEIRQYLLERWSWSCAYCGAADSRLQVEHVRPRSLGGSNRIANLVVACRPCNEVKGSKPVEVFLNGKPEVLGRIQAQLKPSLRHAAVLNSTRRALHETLGSTGVPVYPSSGGRTKWNRSKSGAPKSHTLDALHVGEAFGVRVWPSQVLEVKALGRGVHARTVPDKHGFPRLLRPRVKVHFGFATGDLVLAQVMRGRYAGRHIGRVSVRSSGRFAVTHKDGRFDLHHRHLRLLQRADGYSYGFGKERSLES